MSISYHTALEQLTAIYQIEERIASPPPTYRRGRGFSEDDVGDFLDRISEIMKVLRGLNDNAVPVVIAERYFEWMSSELERRGHASFGSLYRHHDLHCAIRYLTEKKDAPLAEPLSVPDKTKMEQKVKEFKALQKKIQSSGDFCRLYQQEHQKVVLLAKELFVFRQAAGNEQAFETVWCKAVKLTRTWELDDDKHIPPGYVYLLEDVFDRPSTRLIF